MAEIRVEHKKNKPSFWPWILGALLLIGLIWGISEFVGDDDREMEATETEQIILDNGEARPTSPERVTNEEYQDEGVLDEEQKNNELIEEEPIENQ